MGYGAYLLPDGREAGYFIEAVCDKAGCETKIDRGLGYLCGQNPEGRRDAEEPGCGNYYCEAHRYGEHDCTNPACEAFAAEGNSCCGLVKGHDLPHQDAYDGTKFTETEDDLELAGENIEVVTLGEDCDQWVAVGTSDAHSAEMAVRSHFKNEVGESVEEYAGKPVEFGFIYRIDWAWVKAHGADYDEYLAHGANGLNNPRFHGYLVTL